MFCVSESKEQIKILNNFFILYIQIDEDMNKYLGKQYSIWEGYLSKQGF